jgi:hypothetical protein
VEKKKIVDAAAGMHAAASRNKDVSPIFIALDMAPPPLIYFL